MTESIKNIAVAILALTLTGVALDLWRQGRRTLIEANAAVAESRPKLASTLSSIQASAASLDATAKLQRETFNNPQVQRSIGLLLRTGDDLNRTVKKINHTLDILNTETLPKVNFVIEEGQGTLKAVGSAAVILTLEGKAVMEESKLTIGQLRTLLSNPHIVNVLANTADASKETALTAKDVREAVPALLKSLDQVAANTASGTGEVSKYLAGFNAPEGKKAKAIRFILGILLSNARS